MHPVLLPVNSIIHQTNFTGVLSRNVRRAKQHIPQKQHVAEVACVVANAVLVGQGMVRPMGGGCGNGALYYPHHRPQGADFVQWFIPAPRAVRTQNDGQLQTQINGIHPAAKTQKQQSACNPQAGHHQVIEKIVAEGHAHAHVLGGMVSPVQWPQQRRMRSAVPQVLGQIIAQQQHAKHGPPRPVGPHPLPLCKPCCTNALRGQNNQGLGQGHQADKHEQLQLGVVGCGVHRGLVASACKFHQGKACNGNKYQHVLKLRGFHVICLRFFCAYRFKCSLAHAFRPMHNQCTFNALDALTTMNLNQLEHLLALDETRHFAKAANKVHLSQPAFSRSIQALEKQTGLVLFERKGGEIRPSPAGQFLIERARALLLESRSLQRDLHLFQRGEVGDLAFGVGPFPCATLAGHAIQAIRQLYPEVSIRTETGNQTSLLSLLLKEEIEFFVADTREITEAPYLTIETLMRQYGHLYARRGHPLTQGAHCFEAAWRYGIASVKLPDTLKAQLGKLLGRDDRNPPQFALECDDANLLHKVALQTDTLVASTDLAAKPWLESGELVALNITNFPKIFANVSIVSLSNRTLSPVARHAMEQFRVQRNN